MAAVFEDKLSLDPIWLAETSSTKRHTPIPVAVNVTLFDFNLNATYAWDFGDEGTSNGTARIARGGLAPGIYTVQLRSGSFNTTTRRMVIK